MRRVRVRSVMLVGAALVFAACSSSNKSSSSTTTYGAGPTTTAASAYGGSTSTPTTSSSGAVTDTLGVATIGGKRVIVAASGKTVYLYMPDGTSTTSKVPAGLKGAWPAVTASGTAAVGAGLANAKVALETQADGTKQVAYNGHLLYTFAGDAGPGTAKGEGLGGIWYVLSPAGTKT